MTTKVNYQKSTIKLEGNILLIRVYYIGLGKMTVLNSAANRMYKQFIRANPQIIYKEAWGCKAPEAFELETEILNQQEKTNLGDILIGCTAHAIKLI